MVMPHSYIGYAKLVTPHGYVTYGYVGYAKHIYGMWLMKLLVC